MCSWLRVLMWYGVVEHAVAGWWCRGLFGVVCGGWFVFVFVCVGVCVCVCVGVWVCVCVCELV